MWPGAVQDRGRWTGVGDRWSPGAAGLRRRLPRADAPARLPAARSAPPGRPARGTRRNGPRELADAQTVDGRGTRATSPSRPNRGELPWPVAGMVRGLPPHPPWDCQVGTEPVKSAFGVLRIYADS
jgi:hypothetical protein